GDEDPRDGMNRVILCRGTNSGSAGSDAGFSGQARLSGWHYYERSAVGDLAGTDSCRIAGESRRLAHRLLGCFGVNGTDGAGIMAWSATNEIRNPPQLPTVVGFRFQYVYQRKNSAYPRVAGLPDLCQFQHSLDLNGLFACRSTF